MTALEKQLPQILDEFGGSGDVWCDSFRLEALLLAAHEHGVLSDVAIYQVLDDERDVLLVSVEVCPEVYVHSVLTDWTEIQPGPDVAAEDAVCHVLRRLEAIATAVRVRFLGQVAEIVSSAVLPVREEGAGPERN
ncbi:hypothetical protein OG552_15435 [Streptomyces sp. NBC_01476]|uniref:hypothetical protein n=1 Tax=Streptomyces sp. NBC_01476 TaxID=2903881 RepID=UPI002E3193DB|nr:hypothetical protein [Streptomyces sp. NBC_01476]